MVLFVIKDESAFLHPCVLKLLEVGLVKARKRSVPPRVMVS